MYIDFKPDPLLKGNKKEKVERLAEYCKLGTLVKNSSRPNFADVQKLRRKYPLSFRAPSSKKRNNAPPRSRVKVKLNSKRFFIELLEVFREQGKIKYAGVVLNDLEPQNGEIDFGDPVIVEPKHILSIYDEYADLLNPPKKPWELTSEKVNKI